MQAFVTSVLQVSTGSTLHSSTAISCEQYFENLLLAGQDRFGRQVVQECNFVSLYYNEDQLDRSPPHVPGIPDQEAGGLQGTLGQVVAASCKPS